jgi:hypothetical protein
MDYNTNFSGQLKFKNDVTSSKLAELNTFLGKDRRTIGYRDDNIYEDGKYGDHWYRINLILLDDFSGIEWNGSMKTYGLEDIVNFLIDKCQLELEGELLAQGEDNDDRWRLVIVDGRAVKIDFPRIGDTITCPCCDVDFTLEGP